jgi:FkbM family methyltransferase
MPSRLLTRARRAAYEVTTLVLAVVRREPRRKALAGRQLMRGLSRVTPVIALERDHRRIFVSTHDRGDITAAVFASGTYERETVDRAVEALRKFRGLEEPLRDGCFVDVGANIGITTLEVFRRHGARRGVAVEPHPELFKLLRHNLIEAGIDDCVHCCGVAASDHDGDAQLAIARGNLGDHRIASGAHPRYEGDLEDRRTVAVPARRLDTLLREAGVSPTACSLVWIDIQGYEPRALAGADELISCGVPIICEYWPDGLEALGLRHQFHDLVAERFDSLIDLDAAMPAGGLGLEAAHDRLRGTGRYTNLLLLSRPSGGSGPPAAGGRAGAGGSR